MGYYSIYKIFKDIIKTLFGSKFFKIILIILIIFTIIFIMGDRGVFATSSNTISYTDNSNTTRVYALPDWITNYYYCVTIRTNGSNYGYSIVIANNPLKTFTEDGTVRVTCSTGIGYIFTGFSTINVLNNISTTTQLTINSNTTSTFITTSNTTRYSVYCNHDIVSNSNNSNVVFPNTSIQFPSVSNSLSDLESLNFDVISVNAYDWSNQVFDILFYDRNVTSSNSTEGLYPKRVITLSKNTTYFQSDLSVDPDENAVYWIPIDEIGLNLYVGGTYEIRLAQRVPLSPPVSGADYFYDYLGDPVTFTVSSDVSQDKLNALNKEIEDTTNKKYHEETINKMDSINNNINNLNNNINNVNEALTNTTPDNTISSDIDNSLSFDNQNDGLNSLNGGFFSRLTTMLSNLLGYNLGDDTTVSIPLPNSNNSIILHSKHIYDNVTGALRLIINAFWIYIFSFYMWKFINKIYIAVSTGNILDTFSSSGEAITNDML